MQVARRENLQAAPKPTSHHRRTPAPRHRPLTPPQLTPAPHHRRTPSPRHGTLPAHQHDPTPCHRVPASHHHHHHHRQRQRAASVSHQHQTPPTANHRAPDTHYLRSTPSAHHISSRRVTAANTHQNHSHRTHVIGKSRSHPSAASPVPSYISAEQINLTVSRMKSELADIQRRADILSEVISKRNRKKKMDFVKMDLGLGDDLGAEGVIDPLGDENVGVGGGPDAAADCLFDGGLMGL